MPIEIKELKIKAVVSSAEKKYEREKEKLSAYDLEKLKRELKRECIEEIKQFIKEQNER